MPSITFGKRQRFTHIPSQALAERVIPAFLMGSLAGLFPHTPMGFLGEHRLIGLPEVTVTGTLAKGGRDAMPQAPTGAFTMVANHKGQNMPRAAQQHRPEPPFVHAFSDKTPRLIDLQDIIGLRGRECLLQRRQGLDFFLIQAASVFRDTPKIRLIPRILGRSK